MPHALLAAPAMAEMRLDVIRCDEVYLSSLLSSRKSASRDTAHSTHRSQFTKWAIDKNGCRCFCGPPSLRRPAGFSVITDHPRVSPLCFSRLAGWASNSNVALTTGSLQKESQHDQRWRR